jgi:iron complex transport system permease protein
MSNALSIQKARFSHGEGFTLQSDHLDFNTGEFHMVIGPNGSGKSTLARLLCGALPPESGCVLMDGRDLKELSSITIAKQLAFLPQHVEPLFGMRVREVVAQGRHPWARGLGIPDEKEKKVVFECMVRTGVQEFGDRWFHTLSGGERQRVLLASVLAQEPTWIILDEPTNALDVQNQIEVHHLLREIAASGKGVVMITHELALVPHFADRVTLLLGGSIQASGKTSDVLNNTNLQKAYGDCVKMDTASGDDSLQIRLDPEPSETWKKSQSREKSKPQSSLPGCSPRQIGWKLLALFLFFLMALAVAPMMGPERIHLGEAASQIWNQAREDWSISAEILDIRLPRVTMGLLAGLALSCAGAAFQSLFRNPLAEPYTLGIASSSALGAVLAITIPALQFDWGIFSGVQVMSLSGCLLSMVLIVGVYKYLFSNKGTVGLLLLGITIGLMCSGAIMLIRFLSSPLTARAMDHWLMGGIDVTRWSDVLPVIPLLFAGLTLLFLCARDLNQIEMGAELARARGVSVQQVQTQVLIGGSLATASVVSVVGPIGFVGLLVPHLVRRLTGPDLRWLLPGSLLAGAGLMMLADALSRSIAIGGRGTELPVGIFTSLLGGFVFILLIFQGYRKSQSHS